ncbi:hypothetical protein PF005_g30582 [Phytophthora fragariae]|uniref:Uncharacterized protein n=1 Tax=Phytophthora fragariae TaxID=53985 RepID=A0A6A3V8R6_9STRA|nr:hypothetical protein PF005_g30582 [Phytophthora fragariae]
MAAMVVVDTESVELSNHSNWRDRLPVELIHLAEASEVL